MKALIVEPLGHGPVAQYTYRLACALSRRVEQVILLTTADSELLHPSFSAPAGLVLLPHLAPQAGPPKFYRGPVARKAAVFLAYIANAARLLVACRRHRPNVAHVQNASSPDALFAGLLRAARVPVVCTIHNLPSGRLSPHHQVVRALLYRIPNLLVAHANGTRRQFLDALAVDPRRLTIMPLPESDNSATARPMHIGRASWLTIARRTAVLYSEVVSGPLSTNL